MRTSCRCAPPAHMHRPCTSIPVLTCTREQMDPMHHTSPAPCPCITYQQWLPLHRGEGGEVCQACQGLPCLCTPRDDCVLQRLVEGFSGICIEQLILGPSERSQQVGPCSVCRNEGRARKVRVIECAAEDEQGRWGEERPPFAG